MTSDDRVNRVSVESEFRGAARRSGIFILITGKRERGAATVFLKPPNGAVELPLLTTRGEPFGTSIVSVLFRNEYAFSDRILAPSTTPSVEAAATTLFPEVPADRIAVTFLVMYIFCAPFGRVPEQVIAGLISL
jgi:hypothetical protein